MASSIVAPFALGLVDTSGNLKNAQESISLADLIAQLQAQGLGMNNVLLDARVVFGTANAGINDGDNINPPIGGWTKQALQGNNVPTDVLFQQIAGVNTAAKLNGLNGRRTMRTIPTATVGSLWFFRPFQAGQNPVGFGDAFLPTTGAVAFDPTLAGMPDPSVTIAAWVRKFGAGDASDCRDFFGFTYVRIIAPSGSIARIGLLGDGAGGYRYGSVNCPDGTNAAQNLATDVDAGAVQPADLAAPGTGWWRAAIKLIPPTPTQSGRWAAYHNGRLVKVFDQLANFPRGYFSGVQINDGYRAIEAAFGTYDSGGGIIVPSSVRTGIRLVIAEDWSTPDTLNV